MQKRLLRRMLDCLIFTSEGVKTFYFLDTQAALPDQNDQSTRAKGENPLAPLYLGVNQTIRRMVASSNLMIFGASDFVNGAA